jgi:Bacterial regulatory helix-turn-helix protein, lysR family
MRPRLPSLNALRAFEAAARHKSFTRAAEELCATQGAVSPKPSLPANFSIANASAFVITEAGRDYYNFCSGHYCGRSRPGFLAPRGDLEFRPRRRPLHPRKQTSQRTRRRSGLCQKRSWRPIRSPQWRSLKQTPGLLCRASLLSLNSRQIRTCWIDQLANRQACPPSVFCPHTRRRLCNYRSSLGRRTSEHLPLPRSGMQSR